MTEIKITYFIMGFAAGAFMMLGTLLLASGALFID